MNRLTIGAISFSGAGDDILQKLRDVALPDQWWVRCDSLGEVPADAGRCARHQSPPAVCFQRSH